MSVWNLLIVSKDLGYISATTRSLSVKMLGKDNGVTYGQTRKNTTQTDDKTEMHRDVHTCQGENRTFDYVQCTAHVSRGVYIDMLCYHYRSLTEPNSVSDYRAIYRSYLEITKPESERMDHNEPLRTMPITEHRVVSLSKCTLGLWITESQTLTRTAVTSLRYQSSLSQRLLRGIQKIRQHHGITGYKNGNITQ